jgi:hypothetical protein
MRELIMKFVGMNMIMITTKTMCQRILIINSYIEDDPFHWPEEEYECVLEQHDPKETTQIYWLDITRDESKKKSRELPEGSLTFPNDLPPDEIMIDEMYK